MDAHPQHPPAPGPSSTRRLLRWAYTSNPFYVISADLVFLGLRLSFDTSGRTFETGALMAALLGYTLLLATTACLLIRIGKVWDDTRTILLLIVAMFLAVSVTFDETLAANPRLGRLLYVGGLLFAVAVSEGVLGAIRLRLPAYYRVPYYLILCLFFLYPISLSPLLLNPESPTLQWALFAFSPLGGLAFLTLIPAIRRGPGYLSKNGSPWRYPLYPWVLFGLLAAAVCGRAYYVCVSFHFVGRSLNIFGPYFLVPILFALNALLLEAGFAGRKRVTQGIALLALPALVALASIGQRVDPVYQGFQTLFLAGLGSTPLHLTLFGAVLFAAYAAYRQAPLALGSLTIGLLVLSVVEPTTRDWDGLVAPRAFPLCAVACLQFGLAVRRDESLRALVASGTFLVGLATGLNDAGLNAYQAPVLLHLAVASMIAIGVRFDDPLGRALKKSGAWLLVAAAVAAAWLDPALLRGVPTVVVAAYPPLAVASCAALGYVLECRTYYRAAIVGATGWICAGGWPGYRNLRQSVAGLDWIVVGLAFFIIAALISLGKAGLIPPWVERKLRRAFGAGG